MARTLLPSPIPQIAPIPTDCSPITPNLLLRLLVTRQHHRRKDIVRAFPWAEEVEIAELLLQLDLFVNDSLCKVIVAHLDETGCRKILAQRMTLKTVVGEDAAQVRVA